MKQKSKPNFAADDAHAVAHQIEVSLGGTYRVSNPIRANGVVSFLVTSLFPSVLTGGLEQYRGQLSNVTGKALAIKGNTIFYRESA